MKAILTSLQEMNKAEREEVVMFVNLQVMILGYFKRN